MQPKLVYIHIPKTAGTSFRLTVWDIYGKEKCFWYGLDDSGSSTTDKRIVGGHKWISFYSGEAANLYCSMLRDPVSRVVSLFSFHTRPDSASSELGRLEIEKNAKTWLEWGIDPESIVRSIVQCKQFKNGITNYQCACLSRYGNTFEGVLKTIRKHNFILGDTNQSDLFVKYLGGFLNWPEAEFIRENTSKIGGQAGILEEEGAIELIRELSQEDQKLYDFIAQEHGGLFLNINSESHLKRHLSLATARSRVVL